MTGRKDKNKIKYQCSSYNTARCAGEEGSCGFYTIEHEKAFNLIKEELESRGIQFDQLKNKKVKRKDLLKRMRSKMLDRDSVQSDLHDEIEAGLEALFQYAEGTGDYSSEELQYMLKPTRNLLRIGRFMSREREKGLFNKIRTLVSDFEMTDLKRADERYRGLDARLKEMTTCCLELPSRARKIAHLEIRSLELQMDRLEMRRRTPLRKLCSIHSNVIGEISHSLDALQTEFDGAGDRQKGESLKRVLDKVLLFWSAEWHKAESKPTRQRKTQRPGRNKYRLDYDKIKFEFSGLDLVGSW